MLTQQDRYKVAMATLLTVAVLTTFVAMAHAVRHLEIFH